MRRRPVLTDYSQLPLAERNVLRRLFTRPEARCTLEDWQRVGQLIVNAFRADVTRMGATKETDQLIAELSQQSVEFARFGKAMTSPVMEKAISALTTRRWVSSTSEFTSFAVEGRPDLSLLVFNPATTESQRKIHGLLQGLWATEGKLVQRQRVALQRVDPQPIAIEPGFIHAERRTGLMHQPLIILGVRAAAAAKGVHQREQRAVVLIEQVLFDAPAAIRALQPHAVGLAEALDKGRFAGEPGIVDHRIAQQQLVVTLGGGAAAGFYREPRISPRSRRQSQSTQ